MEHHRQRTKPKDVPYSLYLYFLCLSYRNTAKALSRFVHRSHVSIWKWIQKNNPKKTFSRKRKIQEFVIDETPVRVGSQYAWLWVAVEPKNKQILALTISMERNMLVAERFIAGLVKAHGKHPVSTDGGTWYPQACLLLRLKHHLHSSHEKSLIERTMQYIKDRTECFDDYFPCRKKNCKLEHIKNWLNQFVYHHNKEIVLS